MSTYRLILTFIMGVTFHFMLSSTPLDLQWQGPPPGCNLDQPVPVHTPEAPGARCATTFVTEYFHIPSKHLHEEYIQWIQNMPPLCLVVFTDSPQLWAKSDHTLVVHTTLCAEASFLNRSACFWREQWFQDPEAATHKGFLLYLTWNLKARFLSRAAEWNPYSSDYFFWIDAGYARYPLSGDGRALVPSIDPTRMHFLLVNRFTPVELKGNYHYTVAQDRLAGNLFGGHRSAVAGWTRFYFLTFNEYLKRGWFVGKDQNIMNTLCAEHPGVCLAVDPQLGMWANPWFSLWGCLMGQRTCVALPMDAAWTSVQHPFHLPLWVAS